jgi:flagellar biosynthesis protein FlhG
MDLARTDTVGGDQADSLRSLAGREMARWQRPPGSRSSCRVVAITGGKGGVGKTNIAVNLSLALAEAGARVLLFDADLGLANVDVVLGITPPLTLDNVMRREAELEQVVYTGPFGLHFLPGGTGFAALANAGTLEIVRLLGQLRALERDHDLIILDTAAGIADNVLRFVQAADDVVIVSTPEPTALLDAFGLLKALAAERQRARYQLLVNMVRQADEVGQTHRSLAAAALRFTGTELGLLGALPRDPAVEAAVKRRVPVLISAPASPAAQQLRMIAGSFLGDSFFSNPTAADSYFARLLSAMR